MSNYKMKSLLKGLRYISQMFENEKEPEMQIGNPTDVKHVAHIGWDGGSANQNSPSWMNDFKATSDEYSSASLGDIKEDASLISEGSTRLRDKPKLPKSSKNRNSANSDSPMKDRSEKSRRGSSNSSNGNTKASRKSKESSSENLLEDSTNSGRKKSKDSTNSGSSRTSRKPCGSQSGSCSLSDVGSMISISTDS